MTTPLLYADVADLQSILSSTDSGVGSPAELSPTQLTLALQAATNRVSVYFGNVMDSSSAQADPPPIFHDLTLDLAAFYAWRIYLKGKAIPQDHPAYIAYKDAITTLTDARDGVLRLDPVVAGGIGEEVGVVINRIPNIFTGEDSNTRIDPGTGTLESDTPFWSPRAEGWDNDAGGPIYQG